MSNPFDAYLAHADEQMRREGDTDVAWLKLKGKHVRLIKRLLSKRLLDMHRYPIDSDTPEEIALTEETDRLVYEALMIL